MSTHSQAVSSTIEDLNAVNPNWNSQGLTWEIFGTATQELMNSLMTDWNLNTIQKMTVHNIWIRHPHRFGLEYVS